MGDPEQGSAPSIFIDAQSKAHTAIMAMISEEEFAWAQIVLPDLGAYPDYQDWLDCREGFQMGLAMAGVEVRLVDVALTPFLAWCRLTKTDPSERALDAFASMLLIFRRKPTDVTLAVVRRDEFNVHAGSIDA